MKDKALAEILYRVAVQLVILLGKELGWRVKVTTEK